MGARGGRGRGGVNEDSESRPRVFSSPLFRKLSLTVAGKLPSAQKSEKLN